MINKLLFHGQNLMNLLSFISNSIVFNKTYNIIKNYLTKIAYFWKIQISSSTHIHPFWKKYFKINTTTLCMICEVTALGNSEEVKTLRYRKWTI